MNKILTIGHRGAKGHAPENTLLSFKTALAFGVDGIELDVHLSADQEIVVIHDDTINRTTNQVGMVNSMTLKDLKSAKIDNHLEIPTLCEVLDLIDKKCFVNIELKGAHTTEAVLKIIEHYISEKNWNYNHFLVSSFNWVALLDLHLLNPKIPLGVLTESDLDLALAFAKFIEAKSIHPYYHLLTHEKTTQIQDEGFQVLTWTVNEPEDIQKIKSFHVNGIISDFPDRI
jgi:glycerophosphoryl diester phosphodiesterase